MLEDRPQPGFEGLQRRIVERLPVRGLGNGVAKEVVGEKAPLECGVDAHYPINPDSALRFSMAP